MVLVRKNLGYEGRSRLEETVSWDRNRGQIVGIVAVDANDEGLVGVVGSHEREGNDLDRCASAGGAWSDEKNLVGQVGVDLESTANLGRGVLAQVLVEHESLGGIGSEETRDSRHDAGGAIV